jgi:CheY-like chemotaxis protein
MNPTAVGDSLTAMDALWAAAASRQPYALILLDARMPDTDGLSLAAKIRERAELAATRIILLTSGDRPGDRERFRELRVEGHILKPVPQDELYATIVEVTMRPSGGFRVEPTSLQVVSEAPQTAGLPLRVLVAEDNPFNSQLLQQLLASRGHAMRVAHNGRAALEYAKSGAFDVLLLDLHMPELDGFQVIEALRQQERATGTHLPTIALTARARAEDRARCLAAGMDDFLAKPVRAAELWSAIERATVKTDVAPHTDERSVLVSAEVLLAACGGSAAVLDVVREGLRARLPKELTAMACALEDRDARRLREEAHSACGMLAAFSTEASAIASSLEDLAAADDLRSAGELLARLRDLAPGLLRAVDEVTIESLLADAARAR